MIPSDYQKILEKVWKKLGKKALNTVEIDNYCKKHIGSKYRGCVPWDWLPKLKNNESCIVNLDDSTQGGSHWVAMVKNGDEIIVYDSFGRPHEKILPYIKGGNLVDTDPDAEQIDNAEDGETCGQRSIAFIKYYYKYGPEKAMEI